MRFQRLDLNLLVALEALLRDRNVSLAADRIGLSPSATSNALGRLRDYFEDDLLVQKGRRMHLTPRAAGLLAPIQAILEQIRETVTTPHPFDPTTCDRQLRVMASDYVIEVLLGPAIVRLSRIAPKLRFAILPFRSEVGELIERGGADLAISIDVLLSADHPSSPLFEDSFVVIADQANERLQGGLDREAFFSLGHVAVEFDGGLQLDSFSENCLHRRVEVTAPHFTAVPALIVGSDRISIIQRRLADRIAKAAPLCTLPLPIPIPPLRQAAQWHRTSGGDPVLEWFIRQLKEAAA